MLLQIEALDVQFGKSRILHGVSLGLDKRPLAVVGRNGMGKTTLCYAIMGMAPVTGGSVRLDGKQLVGLKPHCIARLGVALVPQGRRVFTSLTVEEHLRLVERPGASKWTRERIYELFPRLLLRRRNTGAQLSGGEQQMLAIARGLLCNPRLMVMDEPTEGLAPLMVQLVVQMMKKIVAEDDISILLVEQNLSVATTVADTLSVMVNGCIEQTLEAAQLADNHLLQQSLLGVSAAKIVGS
jgi:ABC-type branched-subunit amino acid transport system ATPase component